MFCALLESTTVLLEDSVSKRDPDWIFYSSGDNHDLTGRSNKILCSSRRYHSLAYRPCLQRCSKPNFFSSGDNCDLTGRSNEFLRSSGGHHSLAYRLCLQRCFQVNISSLLEIIVILLEDQMNFCALLGGTTVSLIDPVSRDVSNWIFLLFWR